MIDLRSGAAHAAVSPERGAALAGLWCDGVPVLRPLAPGQEDDPFSYAMNVLAPFSNRISGSFWFEGRHHSLTPNLVGEAYPIHGDAFQRVWETESLDQSSVTLKLPHGHFGPFRYQARLTYQLTETRLRAELTLTNVSELDLPFGAGFHPWFPRTRHTKLSFVADGLWPEGKGHLPATKMAVDIPQEINFEQPRGLPEGWINTGFSGWSGTVLILQENSRPTVRLRSDDLSTLIVYSPGRDANFVCIEPVSHPVDAHNLPGMPGLSRLAPGGDLTVTMQLEWGLDHHM